MEKTRLTKVIATTAPASNSPSKHSENTSEQIDRQTCRNIYIGLCGPIGAQIKEVGSDLERLLQRIGYEVSIIKISKLFDAAIGSYPLGDFKPPQLPGHAKDFVDYRTKQEKGNYLRRKSTDPAILATLAINEIGNVRIRGARPEEIEKVRQESLKKKRAFIIDQLKRPEEVELLRQVYKNLFYLYAVVETKDSRLKNLTDNQVKETDAITLIEIDKEERPKWGQNVEKTVLEADYFHNNNEYNRSKSEEQVSRFIQLIHGLNGLAPTQEEFGMYQAHTAGLGSLCLSRQVGAAILDSKGNVLSVGRNDVPKYGGGLYEKISGMKGEDKRCAVDGTRICYNDKYKRKLKDTLKEGIAQVINGNASIKRVKPDVKASLVSAIADLVESNSEIKSLIEYSRSVHAEMDAIVSIARKGTKIEDNCTLYTTVFPCHLCASNIIAAGIKHIVYIEPYEKSLAIKLHFDSLTMIPGEPEKAAIRSFQGVAPRRYQWLFHMMDDRKKDGKAIDTELKDLSIKDVYDYHVASMLDLELKCTEVLTQKGLLATPSFF